jgi:hypothetical protein
MAITEKRDKEIESNKRNTRKFENTVVSLERPSNFAPHHRSSTVPPWCGIAKQKEW